MDRDNILFYDIETTPVLCYTWDYYETNVIQSVRDKTILTCAFKPTGGKAKVIGIDDFPHFKRRYNKAIKDKTYHTQAYLDDREVCEYIKTEFDKYDAVCAHNGDKFDMRIINARFIKHGIKPINNMITFDTLKMARKLGLPSRGLNGIAKYYDLGKKLETGGFDTWLGCIAGDPKSFALMKKYNIQDVILLEKVYEKLRPFVPQKYARMFDEDRPQCPRHGCGSRKVQKRGFRTTKTTTKQAWQCGDCGSWWQGDIIDSLAQQRRDTYGTGRNKRHR